MRPEFAVPRASQKAIDKLNELDMANLPEVELPDMPDLPDRPDMPELPDMPDMPELAAPMFPELTAPGNFPDQAGVDFADLPMGNLPDVFDMI